MVGCWEMEGCGELRVEGKDGHQSFRSANCAGNYL